MIFLKKSSLRAAVFRSGSGQITIWLSLGFLVFLSLYTVCLQSVLKQQRRQRAEQAVEAGMFSLFSEFEPHLLEKYDLFYLDSSFRSGKEKTDELCSHLWNFTQYNLTDARGRDKPGLQLQGVNVDHLVRATDGGGAVFYRQAVQVMKEKSGADLAEEWLLQGTLRADMEEDAGRFQKDCERYEGSVENYEDEEEELEAEARQWDGLRKRFLFTSALPDAGTLSQKGIDLSNVPSQRALSKGTGYADGSEDGLVEKQWFISYLCEYMKQAQDQFQEPAPSGYLDYQLEYILCGKASDSENLEQVIGELLLMREGANYAFLLTHTDYREKAELLANLLAGLTGNPAVIEGLEHLILLGWAYGESLVEVRQLLGGYELSVYKGEEDWQVPLSGLLALIGDPGKYDGQAKRQEGLGYEGYLRMLLTLQPAEKLAMRSLDIIEGELQQTAGCEKIHVDHCIEKLTAQVWLEDMSLERTYGYE